MAASRHKWCFLLVARARICEGYNRCGRGVGDFNLEIIGNTNDGNCMPNTTRMSPTATVEPVGAPVVESGIPEAKSVLTVTNLLNFSRLNKTFSKSLRLDLLNLSSGPLT